MSRPTVNDIAREAGVSLATIDRVLNARPGVKAKTVAAVHEAIAKLGYVRDVAAANLARQRQYKVVAALPDGQSQFMQALHQSLKEAGLAAVQARMTLDIRLYPEEDVHALAALLAGLPDETDGVALMAPETPVVRDAIKALKNRGIPVVALVSDLPNTEACHFVGIDGRASGRTAGVLMGRFVGQGGRGQILALAPSMNLRDAIERRSGFDEVMLKDFPHLEVLPTLEFHGSDPTLRAVVREALANATEVRGIYVMGSGHRALGETLADLGQTGRFVIVGHELTPYTRRALLSGHLDAVITQNLGHLARSVLRVLRAKADNVAFDPAQEALRIEIVIRENLYSE